MRTALRSMKLLGENGEPLQVAVNVVSLGVGRRHTGLTTMLNGHGSAVVSIEAAC